MTPRQGIGLRAFVAKLRGFLRLRPHHRDDEFDAEIQDHLRLLADRYVAQGMSRGEAAAAARRQFGNVTILREDRNEMTERIRDAVLELKRQGREALDALEG